VAYFAAVLLLSARCRVIYHGSMLKQSLKGFIFHKFKTVESPLRTHISFNQPARNFPPHSR